VGKLRLSRATLVAATLALPGPYFARAQDHSPDIPHIIDIMERLCLGGSHTLNITATADTAGNDTVIGEESVTELGFFITPDQQAHPLNKEIKTSTKERRELTLPDGHKITGCVTVTREQAGWQKGSVTEDQAQKVAVCMQPVLDRVIKVLPSYFTSSLMSLPLPEDVSSGFSDASFEFLSNTKIVLTIPSWKSLEKSVFRLRLAPPFLLSDLSAALGGGVQTVPSSVGSPVRISAELLYEDARVVQQLSSTLQDLRAFPPTEWLWLVEPDKSGEITAFVKFTVMKQGGDLNEGVPFLYQLKFHVRANLWGSVVNFVASNWQWMIGTLFIPFLVYVFHAFWPKKAGDVTVPVPPPPRRTTRNQRR
jgi:hypothetical protein